VWRFFNIKIFDKSLKIVYKT